MDMKAKGRWIELGLTWGDEYYSTNLAILPLKVINFRVNHFQFFLLQTKCIKKKITPSNATHQY